MVNEEMFVSSELVQDSPPSLLFQMPYADEAKTTAGFVGSMA